MAEQEKEVRIRPDLEKYVKGVSGSGKRTMNCGDQVAKALEGFTLEEVRAVASKMLEVTQKDLTAKYEHLNPGMQIMNLRNRIRGEVNRRDKAHEQDKAVVPGLKALELECKAPREAANKRAAEAAKAAKEREAKAAAAAIEKAAKAKAQEKGQAKAKGKSKAA